ncbi:MAG: glycyl-radical enzyme activating protein [Peptococcaceae bacterium]|jgi:pyruvate formate lyase activating enzyme|nr:glycyl-radical enzyme activating protein [Peptococcaceae bacterium]
MKDARAGLSGFIFDIQRFSLHDGRGIRTLVFTKGCPLRCRWCSNPEGLSPARQIMDDHSKCIGCGACARVCPRGAIRLEAGFPISRADCDGCGRCAESCPAGAKTICGQLKTVDEILAIAERDRPFYTHSGGGITLGGGEILSQPAFVWEILRRCGQRGVSAAVETSGYGEWDWLARIAGLCEIIHFDIKAIDPIRHKAFTGQDNALILENLRRLDRRLDELSPMPRLILRLPLVPGYNATEEHVRETAAYIRENLRNYQEIELLPFHNFGEQKYKKLDMAYELTDRQNTRPEELSRLAEILTEAGLPARISSW